jgi:3-deoxy-7-phosphoheptulonate synthase
MIIVLKPKTAKKDESALLREIRKLGYTPHVMRGVARTVIGAIGDERTHASLEPLANWPQVESVTPIQKRYKLVSREAHPTDSTVTARGVVIGGRKFQVMAGPCSVESEDQLLRTAVAVKEAGATILRGGAFKPRTSPYEFQGLGEKGLKLLAKARRETGLPIITELLSENHADLVAEYADILQIGTRNAQNFQLLIAAAKTGTPRPAQARNEHAYRGMAARRRIHPRQRQSRTPLLRTRHPHLRDLHPEHARPLHHPDPEEGRPTCPVVIDPSQGTGQGRLVTAMCKGAIAMGADALLIEVHHNPAEAWSDGAQQVTLDGFKQLMSDIRPFISAAGRE